MRTVQMTLDEKLVKAVDRLVKRLKTTRSAFTRNALRDALTKYHTTHLEQQHRAGYEKHPVADIEFSIWEQEQVWDDP